MMQEKKPLGKQRLARSWYWEADASLESAREASRGIREFIADVGLPLDEQTAWELLVSEAANNCAVHGNKGGKTCHLDLLVTVMPEKVLLTLGDTGPGFEWPDDTELPDETSESGRGLYLIDTLSDQRHYVRGKGRNVLEVARFFPTPAVLEDQEETLRAMTEELSSCYESLSSIFHFISEARNADSLESFASRLLDHLTLCTSSDFGVLRVIKGGRLETCALCGVDDFAPLVIEEVSARDFLDRWFAGPQSGFPREGELTGIVHPFHHHDEALGLIMLGRHDEAQPFNAVEENMIRTFAEFFTQHLLGLQHEQEAIEFRVAQREFELAAQIQRSLLPPEQEPERGVVATGNCESALSIGGDFYDLIPIAGRGYFFVLGDVMGKGVAASMMAAVTRSAVRSHAEVFCQPAELLRRVSMQLYEDLDRLDMFVTLVVGMVDQETGEVRVANAGHCPVIVVDDGKSQLLEPENPPVGIDAEPRYPELSVKIQENIRILAFSDGLVDPRNRRKSFQDEHELAEWWWQANQSASHAEELKQLLLNHLENDSKSALIADDQTFIIITCEPQPL
jgi:sigma-B regulation protein RsbU (phosphoserine phosphatase)